MKPEELISHLKLGINSPFWQAVLQLLKQNIERRDKEIIENDSLTNEERNRLRLERRYLVQLSEMPQQVIDKYETKPTDAKNFDPYD